MDRLFFALPLDDSCQQALETALQPLRAPFAGVRWLAREDRHLTLAFLGELEPAQTQALLAQLPLLVEPFVLVLDALERLPDARGRILAATGASNEALLALRARVIDLLARAAVPYPERDRPLRPHVTLARCDKRGADYLFATQVPLPRVEWTVRHVHLYRSEVCDGQRHYRVLA